jgi:metal-responsive CopG/Arc/MetJ family transcriptional regulator
MDYNASFLSSDAQTTVNIPVDLIEQINEQLGEEYTRPDDLVEAAVREHLAKLQHVNRPSNELQEV